MAGKTKFDPKTHVLVIWGADPVEAMLDVMRRTRQDLDLILDALKVYQFGTFGEAESFRLGICETLCSGAKEFCEITPEIYENLLEMRNPSLIPPKKKR